MATKGSKQLKGLCAKLRGLRTTFSNIRKYATDLKEGTTANQINVRLSRLDELWESISETVWEIEAQEDFEEGETWRNDQTEFEAQFYDVKSGLLDRLNELQTPSSVCSSIRGSDASLHGGVDHVRLPQIQLQHFDGNIDEWLSFRDIYTSLIHQKTDLPPVEKFYYLKGCLEGEARALVDPLKITAANYPIAWDTLVKRYNNSKLLRKRQVQAMLKLPSLTKESVRDLRQLVEGFDRAIQNLDQVVEPAEYKDLVLVELLTTRLDPTTRRGWEELTSAKDKDTIQDLMEFLQRRIQILESLPVKSDTRQESTYLEKRKPAFQRASHNAVQSNSLECVSCSKLHGLHMCPVFLKMSMPDRESFLRTHFLCRNCLKRGHMARDCSSRYRCWRCKAKHHIVMCLKPEGSTSNHHSSEPRPTAENSKANPVTPNPQPSTSNPSNTTSAHMARAASSQMLLATAVVIVEDSQGSRYPARALLDSGSECNFMSEGLCKLMKGSSQGVNICIQGVGQTTTRVTRKIEATIKSRMNSYSRAMEFLVLPNVTACLPTATVQINRWNIPEGIQLADPEFFRSRKVDVILGIQAFFSFFHSGKEMSMGEGLPTLTESVFGWIVSGEINTPVEANRFSCSIAISDNLEELMSRFWSCEELGATNNYSPEETRCEEQFGRTVRRTSDGRYIVTLPKNEKILEQLGESKEIAARRLRSVERRLSRDPNLQEQYNKFMTEYIELGHMRIVEDKGEEANKRVYLPHHPVIKESSTTTKVRVVFDASCKTSTGISLNDALFAGPIVQQELRSIILRSRFRQIMVVADVEKMFRQIWITPADTPLQCILWFGPNNEIVTYELMTVTYGTKSAPFLATRTLKQLADDEREKFPLAAEAINEDVYMDDVISGADDVESAVKLRQQVNEMLLSGGLRLRKWASNSTEVLKNVPLEDLALPTADGIDWDQDAEVKTLGLTWLPNSDRLKFKFSIPPLIEGQQFTSREILSIIARLFDPMGLLGATITTAKVFMQRLWTLANERNQKFDWDEQLPKTVGEEWRKYHEQLPVLNTLQIARCVVVPEAISVEFHCFSDASMVAYGATVYVRSEERDGTVTVRLLTSKSKVAPLKVQSLPRLELCGALLAAQLWEKVSKAVKLKAEVHFWTDSTCVLQWINSPPATWTTFVANRVAKIQALTENGTWGHVSGKTNPADLISRGIQPMEILNNNLWWNGPDWLRKPKEQWIPGPIEEEPPQEMRKTAVASTADKPSFVSEYVLRFSDYNKLLRATAHWLRLIAALQKKGNWNRGFLTSLEVKQAEELLIRQVQQENFSKEITALKAGCSVARSSPLRWFHPRITDDGLLRVGGRLAHSEESQAAKHPMVLPAKHHLTELILHHYHLKLLHAGPQLLLAAVRQRFWPLGGRTVAKKVVHRCLRCFRAKPTRIEQLMGELPSARVTVARPFSKTGVDYFGPVYTKAGRGRSAIKSYVAVFVCMATKAVHLEHVSDLSTERFLQALRRFFSRRGRSTDIFSDNGTNFVGAKNKIVELFKLLRDKDHREIVTNECCREGIQWHFIPPGAPHFGGLWEAAVRSAKYHLLRVLGDNTVDAEDFRTLLAQVEGCLNSRPLTPISDNPEDLEPLTPAHFLTNGSLQTIPDPDLSTVNITRLNRWQLVQRQLQDFWVRWRMEYLSQLQGRTKNWKSPVPIVEGSLCVIVDSLQPPMKWKMGRIIQVHPGADGVTRVVTLKIANGITKRAVNKICCLPVQDVPQDQ